MTFILYAAVALVLLGSVFIYSSIEVRKVPSNLPIHTFSDSDDLPDIDLLTEKNSLPGDSEFHPMLETSVAAAPVSVSSIPDPLSFSVVFYTDEKGQAMTDVVSDNSAFDGFLRVGEGVAEIGSDAMNVRIGKKFFRFDFHRIRDVLPRGETAIVYFKGDIKGNIFIAENDRFVNVLIEQFSLYSQKG
jgi:hypothetical protein